MYNETGFKKIEFIVLEDSPIIKMQLGRIARKTNLSNYEIIINIKINYLDNSSSKLNIDTWDKKI